MCYNGAMHTVNSYPSTFGQWVKRLRVQRDLTQEMLAELVFCSVQSIRFFESGKRRPALDMAERLADVLEVAADQRETFIRLARTNLPADVEAETPPPATPDETTVLPQPLVLSSLPATATPLIGRDVESRILQQLLLQEQCRLVTLIGAGGMGKTRLALSCAEVLAPRYTHGAGFVALAALDDAQHLSVAVAHALNIPLQGSRAPTEQLLDTLAARRMLLVLDNFEQLLVQVESVQWVKALLERAPGLQLLITSRERLRISNERTFELAGLALVENREQGETAGALQLFLARAQQNSSDFVLTDETQAVVARICKLVGGMPLAIELAAAWVNTLTVAEIADELQRSIDFLVLSQRDMAPRHRSMKAVFDHSWALLSPEERTVLAQLALFRGGFRREEAVAVTGVNLYVLASLMDKSLISRTTSGRYELHELVRQYAYDQLVAMGKVGEVQQRHATAFLTYAERSKPGLYGAEAQQVRNQLELDIDNFRSAFSWGVSLDGRTVCPALALRLGAALARFWYMVPDWREGKRWLDESAAITTVVPPDVAAHVQLGLGIFEHAWGHYATALAHFEVSRELFEQGNDPWFAAWIHSQIFQCHFAEGRLAEAERSIQESLARFHRLHEPWATGIASWQLGNIFLMRHKFDQAQQVAEEGFQLFKRLNDANCMVLSRNLLGSIALFQHDFQGAEQHYRFSLQLCEEAHNLEGKAWCQLCLGQALLGQGAFAQAVPHFTEALRFRLAVDDHETAGEALQGLAIIAANTGQARLAAYLWGAAHGRRGDVFRLLPPLEALYQQSRDQAEAQLDAQTWTMEYAAGQAAPLKKLLEQVASLCLSE